MWILEREGYYFKIYDESKNIAGYFAPEYGEIYPEDKADEVIEEMHKRHEKIKGGYIDRKSTRSELQSRLHLVCRLLLEKKKKKENNQEIRRCKVHNTHPMDVRRVV